MSQINFEAVSGLCKLILWQCPEPRLPKLGPRHLRKAPLGQLFLPVKHKTRTFLASPLHEECSSWDLKSQSYNDCPIQCQQIQIRWSYILDRMWPEYSNLFLPFFFTAMTRFLWHSVTPISPFLFSQMNSTLSNNGKCCAFSSSNSITFKQRPEASYRAILECCRLSLNSVTRTSSFMQQWIPRGCQPCVLVKVDGIL